MANGEIRVSEGEASENGDYIFQRLPLWMPSDPSSGNFKLLDVVGREFDNFEGDLRDVENASKVQTSETVEQVEQLAKIVELPSKTGESLSKYQSRTVAEFQTLTSEGTISDIIGNAATILDTDLSEIKYSELEEAGVVQLGLSSTAVDNLDMTSEEFVRIVQKHSAAGFRIEATVVGGFTYLSPAEYGTAENNPDKGYDGLDVNGDPKDEGGAYAGIL